MTRTIAWFSCGAASAVAAKLALQDEPETIIARCIVGNEHPDNWRFARDVSRWLDRPVLELASTKYADAWEVWERRRYLNGTKGALCTVELKKKVRRRFEQDGDVQIFGYTSEETGRADRFRAENFEVTSRFPLIEKGITKAECFEILQGVGIELPAMYRLGYNNANCVGCVKGGMGYWNKIRRDFPEVFERMAALEETLNTTAINGLSLRQLHPDAGRTTDLQLPECGLFCGQNEHLGITA